MINICNKKYELQTFCSKYKPYAAHFIFIFTRLSPTQSSGKDQCDLESENIFLENGHLSWFSLQCVKKCFHSWFFKAYLQ